MEGNPIALLVSNQLGKRSEKPMSFPQPEAALAWCRQHGTMMIYSPAALTRN